MNSPIFFVIKTGSDKFAEAMELIAQIKKNHPNAEINVEVVV